MPTTDTDPALKSRLDEYWVTATKRMVHFTKMRVPDGTGKFVRVETELPDLKAIADDVLIVWDELAKQSNNELVPPRARFWQF